MEGVIGRPTLYNEDISRRICELIASGQSVRSFAGKDGVPDKATIFRWIFAHPAFHAEYVKARKIQAEVNAEELALKSADALRLVDECTDPKKANAIVQAVKLQVDTFKWTASKLLPQTYGDKLAVEHTVDESLARRLEKAEMQLASLNAPLLIDAKAE